MDLIKKVRIKISYKDKVSWENTKFDTDYRNCPLIDIDVLFHKCYTLLLLQNFTILEL